MSPILWAVLAIVSAFGLVAVVANRTRSTTPPLALEPGESLPRTPLQRLATGGLLVASAFAVAAAGVVVRFGPERFWDDDTVRLTTTGLALGALAVLALVSFRAWSWIHRDDGHVDERDRTILGSASMGQSGAMLVTLACWMIGLTETYRASGAVPVVFLYLIFWSLVMVSLLAWLAGIVLGYRRA